MKTEIMVHCGNAPKMERVIELTVALASKNASEAKTHVREDFTWHEIGADNVLHYAELDEELLKRPNVKLLKIDNALSHGNGAMCEGMLEFEDGDKLYFCMVVEFVNTAKDALVKSAHTYFTSK